MVENINISLNNLGTINKNCVTLKTDRGEVDLYFSYKTLVAVDRVCSVNDWSNTTGKLLNEIEPDKDKRVLHEQVLKEADKRIKNILFTAKEQIANIL